MYEEDIKPCPFCGGKAYTIHSDSDTVYVECWECHASGPDKRTIEDAISCWNMIILKKE